MVDGEQGKKGIEKSIYDSDPLLLLFVQKMNSEKKNTLCYFCVFLYNADNFNLSGKDKPPRLLRYFGEFCNLRGSKMYDYNIPKF